jgi:hypothetical protein
VRVRRGPGAHGPSQAKMAGIFLLRQAMPIANVTPARPSEVIHWRLNAVCTAAGEGREFCVVEASDTSIHPPQHTDSFEP